MAPLSPPVNPFANLSADRYPVGTTLDYFEEVRAWPELHEPRNQVVFGHYGSGKSIALQRLRGSAMARKPRFLNANPFFGIYTNLLDTTFLDSLATIATADRITRRWPEAGIAVANAKERFLAFSIAEATVEDLLDAHGRDGFGTIQNKSAMAMGIARAVGIDTTPSPSLEDLRTALSNARGEIKKSASTMEIFTAPGVVPGKATRLQPALQQLAAIVSARETFSLFPEGVTVFFLIDQLESVSEETKRLVNLALRRENPFFAKVAVRVHGHSRECDGMAPLKLGDDVFPVFIGHTLDTEPEFARVATAVANNMLRHNGDTRNIKELLTPDTAMEGESQKETASGYVGLDAFAVLASGSMRLFLEMCSLAVRCVTVRPEIDLVSMPIPEDCQTQAAIKLARQELERVTTSDPDRGPRVRALVDRLLREAQKQQSNLPRVFKITGDLFPEDALGKDVKDVVRAGFTLDAFRYATIGDATFEDLPESFGVASVFSPAFGISLLRDNAKEITVEDLKKMATPIRGRMAAKTQAGGRPRLFFSTSFARRPIQDSQVRLIKDVFGAEFDVKLGDAAASGNQLGKIVRAIHSCQVILVEVSEPSPSVMLELGMSYALRKRTFVTFNKDADADMGALQSFIRTLDIVPYSFDVSHLKIARDKILQRFQTDLEAGELMEENAYGMTLRPRSDERSVFIYYPRARRVWEAVREKVQERIISLGGRISTIEAAPHNSTSFEEVMFSVHRASRKFRTSCIIDTTGSDRVDLIGSFALGAAYALRRGVLRIEEANHARENELGLWPSPYEKWSSQDDLLTILSRYIRRLEKKPEERRVGRFNRRRR